MYYHNLHDNILVKFDLRVFSEGTSFLTRWKHKGKKRTPTCTKTCFKTLCQEKSIVTWKKGKHKESGFHIKGRVWQNGHWFPERKNSSSQQSLTWMPWDRKRTKPEALTWQWLTVFNLCYLYFRYRYYLGDKASDKTKILGI